jgi:hypothetical protein
LDWYGIDVYWNADRDFSTYDKLKQYMDTVPLTSVLPQKARTRTVPNGWSGRSGAPTPQAIGPLTAATKSAMTTAAGA